MMKSKPRKVNYIGVAVMTVVIASLVIGMIIDLWDNMTMSAIVLMLALAIGFPILTLILINFFPRFELTDTHIIYWSVAVKGKYPISEMQEKIDLTKMKWKFSKYRSYDIKFNDSRKISFLLNYYANQSEMIDFINERYEKLKIEEQ